MTQITIRRTNTQKKIFRSVTISLLGSFAFYISTIGFSIFEVIDYKRTLAMSEDKSLAIAKLESAYNVTQNSIALSDVNMPGSVSNLKKINDNIFVVRKDIKTNFSMLYEAKQ